MTKRSFVTKNLMLDFNYLSLERAQGSRNGDVDTFFYHFPKRNFWTFID
ncbi:unnamed protein product [Oikopleura dioica]|uniref:Uncharacterized protein n=1 Tax=Oikopleura dioica TaxID=34765 RepID=E4XNJ4_OIKDI|nr:unnamed protein product [Oikopleura dioica]